MFNEAVITEKGIALDAKIRAGEITPEFTCIRLGDGEWETAEDLSTAEALKSVRQKFSVHSIKITSESTVMLRAVVNNTDVEEGYYISELGVYATDPDEGEILYSIATGVTDKMDYQPSAEELVGYTGTFDSYVSVSNSEEVTITSGTGAAASDEDFQDYKNEVTELLAGKAPTDHASTATTYGGGNASEYGHVKLSDNYTSSAGAASASVGASSKAVYDCYSNRAPVSHASTGTTYGAGDAGNYGHVKLSDNYTSSAGAASASVGASSKAVYDAYSACVKTNSQCTLKCIEFSGYANANGGYIDFHYAQSTDDYTSRIIETGNGHLIVYSDTFGVVGDTEVTNDIRCGGDMIVDGSITGETGESAVTFDDSGSVSGITSFTEFLSSLVSGTTIATFFRNLKAGLQYVLHVGSIVNNCVTDNSELPLSAAMGKELQDQITELNSDTALKSSGAFTTDNTGDITARCYKCGKVKSFYMAGTHASTWEAGTSYVIGTLDADFSPVYGFTKEIIYKTVSNVAYYALFQIAASGVITITPRTVVNGGVIYINEAYI